MILVDGEIKNRIEAGIIKIHPFDSSLINPTSMDIRLGSKIITTRARNNIILSDPPEFWSNVVGSTYPAVKPWDKDSFIDEVVELDHDQEYWLKPGEFILASQLEKLTLPDHISVKIFGKSSLGRLGLGCCEVAGWVDSGWSGVLTLELKNYHHKNAICLTPGMKIGQFVFFESEMSENPYHKVGRYYEQEAGQGSKGI